MTKRDDLLQDIFTSMDTQQRFMHGIIHNHFAKYGFSPAQLKLLFTLSLGNKSNLKTLAERLYMTPGGLTQLVEPLENSGFLSRQRDEQDRRIIYISLTKSGEKKLADIKKSRKQLFAQALNELDDNELEIFYQIQQKMFSYFKNKFDTKSEAKEN